jgi:hypothetical protein
MTDELERSGGRLIELLFLHLPRRTEENQEKLQSG